VLAGDGKGLWRKNNNHKRKSRKQVMRMSSRECKQAENNKRDSMGIE